MTDEELEIQEQKSAKFDPKAWVKVISYMGEYRGLLLVTIILSLFTALNDILFPLFQRYLIDEFIGKSTTQGIVLFIIAYVAVILFQAFVVIALLKNCLKIEVGIQRVLRNKMFKKFQEFPVSYFNNRSVGYLVAKTMSDTERIGSTLAWSYLDIGWDIFYIIGMFIPMFLLNWKIALVIMAIVPVVLVVSMLFEKKLLEMNRKLRTLNSNIAGALNEGITGAKTIKSLGVEEKLTKEFKGKTKEMCYEGFKYNRLNSLYVSLLIFLGSYSIAAVLSYGGVQVVGGMSIGTLATFITYATSINNPVMQLAESLTNLVANQANVERTLRVLDEVPKIVDTPEALEKYGGIFDPKKENWEELNGDIEFKNVSFKYEGSDKYVLKDFSCVIPRGTSLALVGETGAGKTTIVNLICRFYEPTEGQILIDGVDYRERSQLWLYSNLGYVLQTPHLFSGTIKDNIKYGRPDATDEEMIEASKMVALDKVIEKLEKGYDSVIGECGDTLSTGEKQLITFARALVANPKIIVLDEATSSIDTETEAVIQHAIESVLSQRTSIMIAHRLSTIRNADRIMLIDDGKIMERGTHSELMKKRESYYKLYTKLFEMENSAKYK